MPKIFIHSKTLLRIFIYVYIPIIFLLILVVLVSLLTGIPLENFTRDPAVIAGEKGILPLRNFDINPFVGIISNLGILFWCTSVSVCFFTYFLAITKKEPRKNNNFLFIRFFGFISLCLLFDDLFLFHESIAPKLFLSEEIVYVCYLAIVLFGITRFKKVILQTEWIILCLAFAFFFLSLILDIFHSFLNVPIILEDGSKFLGIASWSYYFILVSFQVAKNSS